MVYAKGCSMRCVNLRIPQYSLVVLSSQQMIFGSVVLMCFPLKQDLAGQTKERLSSRQCAAFVSRGKRCLQFMA